MRLFCMVTSAVFALYKGVFGIKSYLFIISYYTLVCQMFRAAICR